MFVFPLYLKVEISNKPLKITAREIKVCVLFVGNFISYSIVDGGKLNPQKEQERKVVHFVVPALRTLRHKTSKTNLGNSEMILQEDKGLWGTAAAEPCSLSLISFLSPFRDCSCFC